VTRRTLVGLALLGAVAVAATAVWLRSPGARLPSRLTFEEVVAELSSAPDGSAVRPGELQPDDRSAATGRVSA
jgi:hypothetical protein